ncbi:MAG TPA: CHASE domain-containing protein [Opitutaceae bacterium]|jgi:signal transduction histidine kinase/DNA-binding NarL/FixJ family response regulator|nr:CHASE domain-containing protein [Opitutaceae bacterium]
MSQDLLLTPPVPARPSAQAVKVTPTAPLRRQRGEAESGAKQEALERMEQLRSEMLRTMEILHSVQALFEVKPTVTRAEFKHFVQSALTRLPELQALEWIPCVPHAQRDDFERSALADGMESFSFKEIGPDGQIMPARERQEYSPVFYAEPLQTNAPALGLDLASDPRRREALERAARTGLPTATATLRLAQVSGERLGFLVVLPAKSSEGKVFGFGLAVFQVGSLVDEIFSPLVWRGVNIEIWDSEDPTAPIYTGGTPESGEAAWSYQQDLPLVGRVWRFRFTPSDAFSIADPDWLRRSAETLMRTNEVLEENVMERTAQLARLNAALHGEVEVRKSAEAAAASANRAKSLFLAEMSHEIRTPLNIILGYTQLLQRDEMISMKQGEAMRAIVEGGNHLLCLVDGILDLTKIETGQMELSLVDFDLEMIMKALAAMFSPRCQQKGLKLRLESLGDAPIWVRGDERKLRQVLVNLLGNAVKFTDRGEVRLRVVPGSGPNAFRFEVIDTGPGIAPNLQSLIFEPFKQDTIGQRMGGTGLGLSIARRLIELMGGSLDVNSAPGWGSDFFFTVTLPPASISSPLRGVESHAGLRLEKGRIVRALIVEPAQNSRNVLREMLEAVGCEVVLAENATEASDAISAGAPDVVFVDVRTHAMDTETALEASHAALRTSMPKLICYSASAFEHERDQVRELGYDGFLLKPFRLEQICECLTRSLGVSFTSAAAPQAEEPSQEIEVSKLALSGEVILKLVSSAEIGDMAELRRILGEIELLGSNEGEFARRLLVSVERFDTESVARMLSQLSSNKP